MDVSEILTEIDDHGFSDISTTRKVNLINDTVWEIDSILPWKYLETTSDVNTVAGTASLSVSNLRAILSMTIPAQNSIIVPQRLEEVTKRYSDVDTYQGTPAIYYFIDEQVRLYPVPDAIYAVKVRYIRRQAELTSGSVEADILLPAQHHRQLVLGALVRLFASEDDIRMSAYFQQQFDRRLARMIEDLEMKQYDRTDRVIDVFEYDDLGYYY
jgi:hypothetical protein